MQEIMFQLKRERKGRSFDITALHSKSGKRKMRANSRG